MIATFQLCAAVSAPECKKFKIISIIIWFSSLSVVVFEPDMKITKFCLCNINKGDASQQTE